jgi:gamma-glutamyltranspeptidase/glutathione hydrolase
VAERTDWVLERTEAVARGGMVAAKTAAAAEVGAGVLRRGGNAVDAAVATAFAAGVVEPWMSGLGGGGFMVVHRPGEAPRVVEFPMVAPAGATPAMFPLAGTGADTALFGWPAVVDQANIVGHRAVAVPGAVAGLALALERFGTIALADALAPAIRLAEEGAPVTWHTTLTIARDLANLARFPATAAVFCPNGIPPATIEQHRAAILRQPDLARTLGTIAAEGPGAFYEGPLARTIVGHLAEHGAPVTEADFAGYQATVAPALTTTYARHEVATIGKGSGGTTLVETLNLLAAAGVGRLGHNTPQALHLIALALRQAFADRYAYLADPEAVAVPVEALVAADYAAERAAGFDRHLGAVTAGPPERLGVGHGLAASVPEYVGQPNQASDGSTTHLGAIDREGVAVSLTTTLLGLWGSRVVAPGTGVLLNNGMMWFDPEPGRPNSVAGGKRPLSNMAPLLLARGGRAVASLGGSGGRRIMACNAQLVVNLLDHGLSIQPAISAPRIDASTLELLVSPRLPRATRDDLAARGHRLAVRDERLFTGDFASPVGVLAGTDGLLRGGADPFYYPAAVVGVDGR